MRKVLVLAAGLALLAAGSAGAGGAAPVKTLKVGMVTDSSGLNDRGFNHLAYVGLQQAQKRLGITFRVAASRSPADYIPNLAAFARQGYDLVVGVGYTEIGAMGAVAKRFPKTRFAIVDVANGDLAGKPKNVLGLLFREEQVGYLAGYLAGLEAKRKPGPDVVSSVAGEKQPPVDRFIAGYQAGARKADPKITVVNAYSQDFTDQAKCKSIALNQISAGSIAVFAVAGGCGLGALDAARERNVWGIGVDADQSFLGSQILTSATKKVDRAVFLAVQSVQNGKFHGGNAVFGLREGGVGLGKISAKVPKAEVAAVERIRTQLVAGKIVPPRVLK
ncbi:MAG TPA: BMP family ABC transporter substrate-binding protein [Gaiellaceae bacterium]|jgi:basic membrane protein A